jgi:phosphoserine phosphatase
LKELVMIKVAGRDKPGITAALTEVLARYDVTVLDIGQAVIHRMLSLGILVGYDGESGPMFRDLLYAGHELGVKVRFKPVGAAEYTDWVGRQGKPRFIITMLARKLGSQALARVTKAIAAQGLNIDDIVRLSGRVPLDTPDQVPYSCVEFVVRGEPTDPDAMRREFLDLASGVGVDVSFQRDDIYRRNRRLVAFDMDSTLIQVEVIDQLAAAAGVGGRVSEITERAMRGELDFAASFRERLGLLKGLDAAVLEKIAAELPLTEGVERLFKVLKGLGFKTAIISGGFQYFGDYLQKKLGVDYVCANELDVVDGKVTGEAKGRIVDAERKAEFLREIAAKESIDLRQVIAVGDGANDLPMLREAGLGIAFRAKPIVRERAGNALSVAGLDGILYLIGVRDRETMDAIK